MRRRALFIASLLAITLAFATPASADPFGVGGRDTGWLADNHDHDYCWSTDFTWTDLRNKATAAMDYLESSTDFSGGSHQSCNSGTDVYFERHDDLDVRGQYQCFDRSGNECDRAHVRISGDTDMLPRNQRRKTLCHEIGHSAGATHHDSGWGCMVSGTSTSEIYFSHTRTHMNNLTVANS